MSKRQKEWVVYQGEEERAHELAKALDIHPLTARILLRRGHAEFEDAERFLNPRLDDMDDPFLMKDMEAAVREILTAIDLGQRILIFGDYDVDGVSSVALLYQFLRQLGAQVDYRIPLRDQDGYGLNESVVRQAASEEYSLVVTTDCGISNVKEVALAQELGLKVVIVDHHTVPDQVPQAEAVLNPLQKDCAFPFKELAAVGVTFHLLVALRATLRSHGVFEHIPEPDLRGFLDLVALGTVADVVPLVNVNRTFVRHGLHVLGSRRRAGISALMERAQVTEKRVTPQTISFRLAPRLNAAGRMGDASVCVQLLTTESYGEALRLAKELESLNDARQDCEKEILEKVLLKAQEQVDEGYDMLVVDGREWHQGVLGIVASRLVDRFHRPAVLIGIDDQEMGKGSVRSIDGINVIELLRECEDLLETYGGHVAAAGLTVKAENIASLRERLNHALDQRLTTQGLPKPRLRIDCEVELDELDTRFGKELRRLGPFGTGNREPILLCRGSEASRVRIVGKDHLKAKFRQGSTTMDGIGFSMAGQRPLLRGDVAVAFAPRFSTFRGRTRLEMHIRGLRDREDYCPDHIEEI